MPTLALVALGGALGALARAAVVGAFDGRPWWGDLIVNIAGCLAIGYLLVVLRASPRAATWMPLAITGFLGGFTTFSAIAIDVLLLFDDAPWSAVGYLTATLMVGLLAVPAGESLARGHRR